MADTFKAERIPSTFAWEFSPGGQHFELGIAEANLMTMLSALGLSHQINGVRLLPVGTVYDPFVLRAADQLNYACYQDARFLLVGTPSGVTLAPEGGAHQSIAPPLVGMAQDGLAAFEPAFADELAVILRFAFDYMQRPRPGRQGPRPADLAPRRDRRLDLPSPLDPAGRAARPRDDARAGAGGGRRRLLAAAARGLDRGRRRLYRRRRARGRSPRSAASPKPAARRRSSPSPRPTGSTPGGPRRSGQGRRARPAPSGMSSG